MKIVKYLRWALVSLLIIVFFAAAWISYQRLGAFGCADQCFNYVAAYFMLRGKSLYSQIFFNHQPLMAYLSYFIQLIFKPQTLYHLVLQHRLFILAFSFLMNLLIIWRFHWAGVGFALFYEVTKFYLFGHFFLPEAIVVYLLVYLFGLWWHQTQQKPLFPVDYFLAALFTWLIVFLRLPLALPALFLYALFLFQSQKNKRLALFSLVIFSLFSFLILLNLPLRDYFYDVLVINYQLASSETGIKGIFQAFLYPLLILVNGKTNYFRLILIGLDFAFLVLFFQYLIKKKYQESFVIFLLLGLAGIRLVEPGAMFYEAFHLLSWYGLFLMTIFFFLASLPNQKLTFTLIFLLTITFIYATLSPGSFFRENFDQPEEEFTLKYADYFTYGTVIKSLSKPKDALFLEMWNDLIYWQAGLDSAYQYSLYTPVMTVSEKFNRARLAMFQNNPPDFYYAYPGTDQKCSPLFPEKLKEQYRQLFFGDSPTCLYLKKAKLLEISVEQWQAAKELGFYLPRSEN